MLVSVCESVLKCVSPCFRLFENAKAVFKHIVKSHLTGQEGHCQWEGCDGLRRQKWSLVTHVQVSSIPYVDPTYRQM